MTLYNLLADLQSHFAELADVCDGDEGRQEPNAAMSFLGRVERELELLECHVCHREKEMCECD